MSVSKMMADDSNLYSTVTLPSLWPLSQSGYVTLMDSRIIVTGIQEIIISKGVYEKKNSFVLKIKTSDQNLCHLQSFLRGLESLGFKIPMT